MLYCVVRFVQRGPAVFRSSRKHTKTIFSAYSVCGCAALSAGFGSAVLAEWQGHRLPGHLARERPAQGSLDRQQVRVAVFGGKRQAAVLILADVLAFDAELERRVIEAVAPRADVSPRHVVVCATHTHTGPPVFALGPAAAHEPARCDLVSKAARAAEGAVAAVRPVTRLEVAAAANPYAINRRRVVDGRAEMEPNPGGAVDQSITMLTFCCQSAVLGRIAVLAMHPTVLSPAVAMLSGDVAGALAGALEGPEGGRAPCLILQGASGDIRPRIVDQDGRFTGGTPDEVKRMGEELAQALGGGIVQALGARVSLQIRRRQVRLQCRPLRVQRGTRRRRFGFARSAVLRRSVLGIAFDEALAVVFLPGEPFVELSERIKASSAFRHTVVAAHSGATIGYVPTAEAFELGGYEVEEAHAFYGFDAPVAPNSGRRLVRAAIRVLGRLKTAGVTLMLVRACFWVYPCL